MNRLNIRCIFLFRPGLPFFHIESPNSMAPMLGSPSASGEGPTVRQHLQQQQAAQKQRRQQEMMMKRMNKEPDVNPELTRGNSNDQKYFFFQK